jgi:hypothetical protein
MSKPYQHPAEYTEGLARGEIRKFRHKDGFLDGTDFIGVDAKGQAWFVTQSGFVFRGFSAYLDRCLKFVRYGDWIEVRE